MTRARLPVALAAMVLLHTLLAGWFAGERPIDGDEGYYGLAATLVADGQHPYADFFYPQAPVLPYVYAPAAHLVGAPQLPGLRYFSVGLGTLAMALLAAWARRAHGRRPALAMAALGLVVLSPELLTWLVTVKTYALTAVALAASIVACQRVAAGGRNDLPWAMAGGLAMGLAASTRLLLAPAALVPAAWWLLRRGRAPGPAGAWLGGVVVGVVPLIMTLVQDPDRFWFNNVGYHQLRFSVLEDASASARALAAVQTLVVALVTDPGLLLMLGLATAGLWLRRRGSLPTDPAVAPSLAMAGVYTASCLLPDPVHRQYFTGVLPVLLLPAAASGLAALPWPERRTLAATTAAVVVALATSLGLLRHDLSDAPHWRLDHYRQVCSRLASGTRPGDTVFAFWSGYPAGAGRPPQPGMENHFAVGVSERLDTVQRTRYRVLGRQELARIFRAREARVAVVGAWMNDLDTALDDREVLQLLDQFQQNYVLVEEIEGVKLCRPIPREAGSRR